VIASRAHYEAVRAAQAATAAPKMRPPFPSELQRATTEMRGLGCSDRAVRDHGEVVSRPSFDQEGLSC
jgi:hypothetical protein